MKARKISTVSSKGQTTIPVEVRKSLDLHSGDTILFEFDDNGKVSLRKVPIEDEARDYLKFIEMTLAPEWGTDDDDDL
jgi:AbrB family looped-hinge helix DNA binding protein